MFKKYYLILFLLVYSSDIYASVWDDFVKCISNPCSCSYNDRIEKWNGVVKRTIPPDTLCPPWNKDSGRNTDNCLIQFNYPSTWSWFYMQHCAEHTQESTYFAPKIRIRTASCNAFACWNQSTTLNWDGECILWPGAYAIPLLRICARVAFPKVEPTTLNPAGTDADPGYTPGKHLNDVGAEEDDEAIIGDDGQSITNVKPKLCAYSDPGLFNLITTTGIHIDPVDWNPYSQPLHKTTELSPLAKVLCFLVDQLHEMSLAEILVKLLDATGADKVPGLYIIEQIVKALGKIAELFADLMKLIIKRLGALNYDVDDYKFGCVEIPLAPYPPPFCKTLGNFVAIPTTQTICSKKYTEGNLQGLFIQNSDSPCVVSSLANNIVNNSVRVTLNEFVPLCKKGEDPTKTDKCVRLRNNTQSTTASDIHVLRTLQFDNVKVCADPSDDFCIEGSKLACSATNSCNIRLVYGQKIGDRFIPSDYYYDDIPNCKTAQAVGKTTCQEVWGINIGNFTDVSLAFPKIQGQGINDLLPLTNSFSLQDNNGRTRNFSAQIVMVPTDFGVNTIVLQNTKLLPQNIYVFEWGGADGKLVGSESRVKDGYEITTYECGSNHNGVSCDSNNSYYRPQMIASLTVQDGDKEYSTSSVVAPLSVSDPSSPSPNEAYAETTVHLAGYEFGSFVAYIPDAPDPPDDVYTAPPFSGSRAANALTIYGKYKNDAKPYDDRGTPTGAVYLTGLEYIKGKYLQGGSHVCLQLKNSDHCMPISSNIEISGINIENRRKNNNQNCVLAKLLESDTINCSEFKTKSMMLNLGICNGKETNCQKTDSISGKKDGEPGITIFKCDNHVSCYTNDKNKDRAVCNVSMDFSDRFKPDPAEGPIITSHYEIRYKKDDKSDSYIPEYDQNILGLRDKTSQELGFCTKIPVSIIPKCPAISTADNYSGNATWPETQVGKIAIGECKAGWQFNKQPLKRYCLSNIEDKTVKFDELDSDVVCIETGISFSINHDFPKYVAVDNQTYDRSTKTGTFILDTAKSSGLREGVNQINYTVDIKDFGTLKSFKILSLRLDGYLLIKVNDQKIYSGSKTFNDMKYSSRKLYLDDQSTEKGQEISLDNFDLKYYLKQGTNTISIQVGVVNSGSLNYKMQYKMQ